MALHHHHNLFERGIAGALANTIDGTLNLTGTVHYPGNGVGCCKSKVVVAVGRDNRLIDIRNIFL